MQTIIPEEHSASSSNMTLKILNEVTPTGNLAQSSARSIFEQTMLTGEIVCLLALITPVLSNS